MIDKPFFLDSNILMYCFGKDHPLKDPCKKIIDLLGRGVIAAVTDTEVLQEILYRYISIKKQGLAFELCEAAIALCQAILPVTLQDIRLAKEILFKHTNINVRDAVHAASMQHNRLGKILSADTHFDSIAGVQRVDPVKFPFPDLQ